MKTKTRDAQISESDALVLRASPVGNDTQFMRRLTIGGRGFTVISHYCCVDGRFSGWVHRDGDAVTDILHATWR